MSGLKEESESFLTPHSRTQNCFRSNCAVPLRLLLSPRRLASPVFAVSLFAILSLADVDDLNRMLSAGTTQSAGIHHSVEIVRVRDCGRVLTLACVLARRAACPTSRPMCELPTSCPAAGYVNSYFSINLTAGHV